MRRPLSQFGPRSPGRRAATLGFLPLALDHAAADCRRTGIAFDRYRGLAAELIRDVPRGADYAEETPVFATFELAIRKAAGTCAGSGDAA